MTCIIYKIDWSDFVFVRYGDVMLRICTYVKLCYCRVESPKKVEGRNHTSSNDVCLNLLNKKCDGKFLSERSLHCDILSMLWHLFSHGVFVVNFYNDSHWGIHYIDELWSLDSLYVYYIYIYYIIRQLI